MRAADLAAVPEDFAAPGARLGPLDAGTGVPRLGHAARVRRSFGVRAGLRPADGKSAVERVSRAGRRSPNGLRSPAGRLDDLLAREGHLGRTAAPVPRPADHRAAAGRSRGDGHTDHAGTAEGEAR